MKPLSIVVALVAMFLTACADDQGFAQREKTVSSVGTVREIDAANRRFVVRADGEVLTLRATETLRNFDQLEVGDRIRVEYQSSVAVSMAEPSDPGTPIAVGGAITAPAGARPGLLEAEMLSVVVEFIAYDTRDRSATIRTGEGDILRVAVPRELRAFARARQPGDRIAVQMQRAVAVFVEPVS